MKFTWVPNILTLSNLFCGFVAILAALRGRFDISVVLIFAAMLMDMFDGRIARYYEKENPFGKQLDSLADLLSFGIAPGIIFYAAFLGQNPVYKIWDAQTASNLVHLGVGFFSFLFPLFAAIRLAKFNTQEYSDTFEGCPSPVAGGTIILLICFRDTPGFFLNGFLKPLNVAIPYQLMFVLFFVFGVLMVTPIKFSKIQKLFLSGSMKTSKWTLVLNIVMFTVTALFSKFFLVILSVFYVLYSFFSQFRRPAGKAA